MIKTGIFGGSFNPIHVGHIALAREILNAERLDEIWFVISPLNPFKESASDLLDDDKRLELARKALLGERRLMASDYEFRLPRPSYTWNTLQSLSRDYPEREFTLLIGADNWLSFNRWYHSEDILSHYHLIIYPRAGYCIDADALPGNARLVNTQLYPQSSTHVRECIRLGQPITGMVPENILPLVQQYYAPQPGPAAL